jgi:hypothetical protein
MDPFAVSRSIVIAVVAWLLVGPGTPAADAGSYLGARRVATTRPAQAAATHPIGRAALRLDGRLGLGRGPRRPFAARAVVRVTPGRLAGTRGRTLPVVVRGGGAGVGLARVARRAFGDGLSLERPFFGRGRFAGGPSPIGTVLPTRVARRASPIASAAPAPTPSKVGRTSAGGADAPRSIARQFAAAAGGDLDAGRAALASLAGMRTRSPAATSSRLRRYLAHRGKRNVARRLFEAGDLAALVGKAASNRALVGDARKLAARMALAGDADGAVQALELATAAASGIPTADRQIFETGLKLAVLLGRDGAAEQAIASVGLAVGAADRARQARGGVRFARGAIEVGGARALLEIAGRLRTLAGPKKAAGRARLLAGAADAVALAERLDGGHLKRRDRSRMVDLGKRLGRPAMKGAREALQRERAADPFVGGGGRPVRLDAAR